ncbi:hypothetical protein MRX96_040729 [Rhipicephalus microplus]
MQRPWCGRQAKSGSEFSRRIRRGLRYSGTTFCQCAQYSPRTHPFRERRQLDGESIPKFAFALLELAASCAFAEQANNNTCDEFITGAASSPLRSMLLLEGDTLTFAHAVEIAILSERAQL